MTALEFMEKKARIHFANYIRQQERGASDDELENIFRKVDYYQEAALALREFGEIVRCQNCRFYHTDDGYCDFYGECSYDDNFCGNGERSGS